MEYIKSKDLCILIRDTLALIDKKIIDHGSRTAYIFSRMLACEGDYEPYEIADLAILALLHDIGVYKTGNIHDIVRFELMDPMPHSIYGYFFYKYLSPHPEYARILLYHHLDHDQCLDIDDPYIELAWHLSLAEKVEIYHSALGGDFDYTMLRKYAGTRYAPASYKLLGQAVEKYDLITKLTDGSYEKELDGIIDYVLLSDDEKERYLQMLMYCIGFRSEYAVINSVTCICICDEIAKLWGLDDDSRELLYYSALLHDIGMLAVPHSILDAKQDLTEEQTGILHEHVQCARKILLGRIHQDVVDIVYAHHERLDGSGYPVGKKAGPMNDLQKILQLSDTVTNLVNKTPSRSEEVKAQVTETLQQAAAEGKFDKLMVEKFVVCYDAIMDEVRKRSKSILKMHTKLQRQYRLVYDKLKG